MRSLTNKEKASLNSETCSSVRESACKQSRRQLPNSTIPTGLPLSRGAPNRRLRGEQETLTIVMILEGYVGGRGNR